MADTDSTSDKKVERAAYYKAWRAANKEKIKKASAAYYKSNKERMNAEAARRYRENSDSYKARAAEWAKENKERRQRITDKWRDEHPELYAAYAKRSYESNKAAWLARSKSWRDRHPEKMRALRDEWKASNPEACAYHVNLRRTRKMNATPPWADLNAIKAKYAEAARLRRETGLQWHVDHEIPLKHPLVCGLHVHTNLQVMPGKENQRKHNSFELD